MIFQSQKYTKGSDCLGMCEMFGFKLYETQDNILYLSVQNHIQK
jgi:hypothetical protein